MKKIILLLLFIFTLCSCNISKSNDYYIKGTWWWNKNLDTKYLDFACENNINEIYYCDSNMNEKTISFLKIANEKKLNCYLLAGEYQWVLDDSKLINLIDRYIEFNKENDNLYKGIHLDIEPHQHPEFKENRNELITKLVGLIYKLKNKYPNIEFSYDIPFWFEDEITFNNETKEAYKFILDYADRVFIMSYRDTKDGIIKSAKEEIEYAKANNKKLVLCVETYSTEGDNVSFYEEGKTVLNNVLKELENESSGIAIHHIKSWYDLKD